MLKTTCSSSDFLEEVVDKFMATHYSCERISGSNLVRESSLFREPKIHSSPSPSGAAPRLKPVQRSRRVLGPWLLGPFCHNLWPFWLTPVGLRLSILVINVVQRLLGSRQSGYRRTLELLKPLALSSHGRCQYQICGSLGNHPSKFGSDRFDGWKEWTFEQTNRRIGVINGP